MKQNDRVKVAGDDEVDFLIAKKKAWDSKTGLNLFDDERLLRAREAICLAVHVFNSPTTNFKTEVFAVLANIASSTKKSEMISDLPANVHVAWLRFG